MAGAMSEDNLRLVIEAPCPGDGDEYYRPITIYARKLKTKTAFSVFDPSGATQKAMYNALIEELEEKGATMFVSMLERLKRKADEDF
jgi:hypothetical protein